MQDHRKLRVWKHAHELAVWEELDSALVSVRRMRFALRKKVLLSPHAKRMTELSPTTVNP